MSKLRSLSILLIGGLLVGITLPNSFSITATDTSSTSTPFNFIAYGDTRGSTYTDTTVDAVSELHDDIVTAYLQNDPELIVHTGDLAGAFRYPLQVEAFNDSLVDVWNANIPIYFAVGNHDRDEYPEVEHDAFSSYANYIETHNQLNASYSQALDDADETIFYFSFDYQNVHFISINNEWDWDGDDLTLYAPQLNWLLADLAASSTTADFTVVAFHRPAYSVNRDRPYRWDQATSIRGTFHDHFVQYGVDLVFSGHDHYYYRTRRDGIYYVTTGGGGAPLYDYNKAAPDWQSGDVVYKEYHYCNVAVNSSTISVTTSTINGTVLDAFDFSTEFDPGPNSGSSSSSEETSNGSSASGWAALTGIVSMIAIATVIRQRRR
ncbi:MAG: metallophosphoesterase family protein [Candidatus Heimdallarchaeota archaeon]